MTKQNDDHNDVKRMMRLLQKVVFKAHKLGEMDEPKDSQVDGNKEKINCDRKITRLR